MGNYTGIQPGNSVKKRKTKKLTDEELERSRQTILASMFPGSPSGKPVRNPEKSKIWRRQNDPFYRE